MHDGTKVNVKEFGQRHRENSAVIKAGASPEKESDERRGKPHRQSNFTNKLHSIYFLSFSVYIISYSAVKKQRISGKVYVKFAAGWFVNIVLT